MCPDITHCTHSPCMFCSHIFSWVLISHTLHKKPTTDHTHSSIETQMAINTNHWSKQYSKTTITAVVTFRIHVTLQNFLLTLTKAVDWEPWWFCIWDLDGFPSVYPEKCQSANSFWNILDNHLFYHQLSTRAYVHGKSQKTSILKDGSSRCRRQSLCTYHVLYLHK